MSAVLTDVAKVYYDLSNPGGFGGITALERATKHLPISKRELTEWLKRQRTYTLHAPARKRFPTRHYQVSRRDQQWQADLVEMIPFARQGNRGYRYILVVIDILSRYAWARPLKAKTGDEIVRAFKAIFRQDDRKPEFLQTDQGTEFENAKVRAFLRTQNVEQFSVKSPYKAAIVERLNRTLKSRMWRHFTENGTRKWVDELPRVLHAYNHKFHRTLGLAPVEVTLENEMRVWQHLYGKKKKATNVKAKFKVGDTVRLSKVKGTFAKGYLPNWTEEEFIVHDVDRKYRPIMYVIRDQYDEVIEGKFYDKELQRVVNPDRIYMIEHIIRRRKRPGMEREVLVKWLGYPETSWIKESSIMRKNYK